MSLNKLTSNCLANVIADIRSMLVLALCAWVFKNIESDAYVLCAVGLVASILELYCGHALFSSSIGRCSFPCYTLFSSNLVLHMQILKLLFDYTELLTFL